jgi:hypothetical protein
VQPWPGRSKPKTGASIMTTQRHTLSRKQNHSKSETPAPRREYLRCTSTPSASDHHYVRVSQFQDPREDEYLIRLFVKHVAPGRDRLFMMTAPRPGVSRIEDFATGQWLEAYDVGKRSRTYARCAAFAA